MYIVNIHVHVKPEHRDGFIEATLDNARNTVQEPGNLPLRRVAAGRRFEPLRDL